MLTGQNGILNRASEAKEKTELAQKGENKTLQDYEDIISQYTGNLPTREETKPYLPDEEKFEKVEGTDLSTGLVIKEKKTGSEYVWVEVPKTAAVYPTAGVSITSFTDKEYTRIEADLHTYTNDYRKSGWKDKYYSDATTGLTSTQYTELKQKMLKSVYQNAGFYVGKYETGIEDAPKTSESSSTAPTETPVIKQNAYPYNNITCSQAQTLASSMDSGNYTSSLMFGVQWDLILKYLETKGTAQYDLSTNSTTWGNYYNNLWNITNVNSKYSTNYGINWINEAYGQKNFNQSIILSSGASEEFAKQGIYDLAGNVWEWTLEGTSDSSAPCARRGSGYDGKGYYYPASIRGSDRRTDSSDSTGFRIALY